MFLLEIKKKSQRKHERLPSTFNEENGSLLNITKLRNEKFFHIIFFLVFR